MRNLNPFEWAILPFRKYADFSGRAPRPEYWWFYLGTAIVSFLLGLVDQALGIGAIFGTLFNLLIFVPSMAVTVRRLHDTDRTGWWLLAFIGMFAVVGTTAMVGLTAMAGGSGAGVYASMIVAILALLATGVTMLVFMVQAGTDGPNRFGEDPYGPGNLEQVFA